jgi:hypothetical protein
VARNSFSGIWVLANARMTKIKRGGQNLNPQSCPGFKNLVMPGYDRVSILLGGSECTLTLEFDLVMMKCGTEYLPWYMGPRVRKDD